MVLFLVITIGTYVFMMGVYAVGFFRLKTFKTHSRLPKTSFTIVIPFRNESENLGALMQSVLKIEYPEDLTEVVFVNDASEDDSVNQIADFILNNKCSNWRVFENKRLSGSPKKDAITLAITLSKNDWIFTTDADCALPKLILKNLDDCIQTTAAKMIAGPVLSISSKTNFVNSYQKMESLILAGVTMGAFGINQPIMCNGANLAYEKNAFLKVNGFDGNTHFAGGDDLFLLEKMNKNFSGKVYFLKSLNQLVFTKTENSFQKMIEQRVRWAAKASGYKNLFSMLTGLLVLMANISVVMCYFAFALFGFEMIFLMLFLLKWLTDEVFLYVSNSFFKEKIPWYHLRIMAILYPVLTIYISWKAVFGTFSWKGREFKT
jgi:cellulose synthase/poly-beta-1,6-N-acetylglucosamine synthase-like glycosyltransferase